jgi:hypothetical protein
MTDKANSNRVETERLLKNVRPVEPSAPLKERVVGAAHQAWHENATDTPWRIALGRLAAAAVAAIFIVSCANYLSNRAIAPWRSQSPTAVNTQRGSVEEFPEISFGPLLGRVAALQSTTGREVSAALAHREELQEMLIETEPDGPADTPAPTEGRSRMLPARPGFYHYS